MPPKPEYGFLPKTEKKEKDKKQKKKQKNGHKSL